MLHRRENAIMFILSQKIQPTNYKFSSEFTIELFLLGYSPNLRISTEYDPIITMITKFQLQ